MTRQLYNLANIRELLTQGFDDRGLRRLCYDVPDFRPVYDDLARTTGKADIVDTLLEYAERQLLIDTLLALAREQNPARYELHGPYYLDDPTPALQKQISDLAKRLAAFTSPTPLTREQQYQVVLHWVELGRKDSLRGFDLCQADLQAVDLQGADLRRSDLRSANLYMADLSDADLRLADLGGANLAGACLNKAKLSGATLLGARLYRTGLSGADLRQADLAGANLTSADLSGANLTEADLHDAVLDGAILCYGFDSPEIAGADLTGANLMGAKCADVNFRTAYSLDGATMPDGTVHE